MHLQQKLRRLNCVQWTSTIGVGLIATALIACTDSTEHTQPPQSESAQQPAVHCDFGQEGVADLGYVEPESLHELTYVLQAPKDTGLTNLSIESDCPCVEAIALPESIPAGESATLRIQFKAPEKILHYQQDLAIVAPGSSGSVESPESGKSGGDAIKTWLTIDARLGLPLRVTPEELQLAAGPSTAHIEVKNEGPKPVKLIYALSDNPLVKAATPQEPIQPGEKATIQLTAAKDWVSNGSTTIRIKTTHDNQPEAIVRIEPKKE